jgi:hypothetical protein
MGVIVFHLYFILICAQLSLSGSRRTYNLPWSVHAFAILMQHARLYAYALFTATVVKTKKTAKVCFVPVHICVLWKF